MTNFEQIKEKGPADKQTKIKEALQSFSWSKTSVLFVINSLYMVTNVIYVFVCTPRFHDQE